MKNKKLWLLLAVLLCFFGLPLHTTALPSLMPPEETSPGQDVVGAWEDAFAEALPDHLLDIFADADSLEEMTGFQFLFRVLWEDFLGGIGNALTLLLSLLGIVLFGALANLLGEETGEELKGALQLVVRGVCAVTLFFTVRGTLSRATTYLGDLSEFSQGIAPVLGGILVTGGGVTTGTVAVTSLSGMLLIFEKICVEWLVPLTTICFSLSLVSSIAKDLRLGGILKQLKQMYMVLVGVVCAVAGAAFSMQTLLAASADSVAMRTARYAVGSMIPIVGGTIGASIGSLASSLSYIKTSVGAGAVVAVLLIVLPSIIELYLARLALGLTGGFAHLVGFEAGEKMTEDFRAVLDMTLAAVAFASLSFLMYLAVFLKTALPIVS